MLPTWLRRTYAGTNREHEHDGLHDSHDDEDGHREHGAAQMAEVPPKHLTPQPREHYRRWLARRVAITQPSSVGSNRAIGTSGPRCSWKCGSRAVAERSSAGVVR